MQHDIRAHGRSHRGTGRDTNEDQFLVADLCKSMVVHDTSLDVSQSRLFGGSQGVLLLVADGMGGHASGERASTLAIETFNDYVLNYLRWLYQLDAELEDDFTEDLKASRHSLRHDDSGRGDQAVRRQADGHHVDHGLHRVATAVCRPCRRQPMLSAARERARATDSGSHPGAAAGRRGDAEPRRGRPVA